MQGREWRLKRKAAPYFQQAQALQWQGHVRKAIQEYNLVIRIYSAHLHAYYARADCHLNYHDIRAALSDANKLVEMEKSTATLVLRGKIFLAQGNFGHALLDLSRVMEAEPGNALAYFFHACTEAQLGNLERAARDFNCAYVATQNIAEKVLIGLRWSQRIKTSPPADWQHYVELLRQQNVKTADELFLLLLAELANKNVLAAKENLLSLFRNFLPHAVSFFFHEELMSVLINSQISDGIAAQVNSGLVIGSLKSQLVDLMKKTSNPTLQINALLQALCRSTMLGGIMHTPRKYTRPDIKSGALQVIAVYLNDLWLARSPRLVNAQISGVTAQALAQEVRANKSFIHDLKQIYPFVYNQIKAYLTLATPIRQFDLFARRLIIQHAHDQEEGNRFIQQL